MDVVDGGLVAGGEVGEEVEGATGVPTEEEAVGVGTDEEAEKEGWPVDEAAWSVFVAIGEIFKYVDAP